MNGVAGVVGAGAGDDAAPVPHCLHDRPPDRVLLLVGQRRPFAGGAGDDEPLRPVVEQPGSYLLRRPKLNSSI